MILPSSMADFVPCDRLLQRPIVLQSLYDRRVNNEIINLKIYNKIQNMQKSK